MTAAVTAARDFRPFRSPHDKARNLPNLNQRSYDEDEEEGLVVERPVRNSQRSSRNENSETISSNHSRKRPRSLPPQDYSSRQSSYRLQKEPKSEPWSSHQRPKMHIEDSTPSNSHRDRENFIVPATSNQPPSRPYESTNSSSDRDNMCNTPFRRNGAASHRSRHNNHFSDLRDSNRDQYRYNQGGNTPRQQHRWQEQHEPDYWSKNRGEDHSRVNNDRGAYNRNLPARNEEGSGYRRGWNDRRPDERKEWGDRRPGDRGEYNGNRPGTWRDWNERMPSKEIDRNNSNKYHDRQAPLSKPHDDRRENGRQDWRVRNEQASRPSWRFNDSSPQQSRFPQERRRIQTEPLRHQDDHYRHEHLQDQGFHSLKSSSWDESHPNSHLQSRYSSPNEPPRPTRSDDRYFEETNRPYDDFNSRDPRLLPPSSPQVREYNQNAQTHEYRRNYGRGNSNFDRYRSRDEFQENVTGSVHDMDDRHCDRKRQFGYDQGQFVDPNPQTNRIEIPQRREQDNRRYEYSNKTKPGFFFEEQPQALNVGSPGYSAPSRSNLFTEERAVKPKASSEPKFSKKNEFASPHNLQQYTSNEPQDKSLSSRTPKSPPQANKPVTESKKIKPANKSEPQYKSLSSRTQKPPPQANKPVTESKKIKPPNKSALGIPMSWLKPKAKPKKPIQKTVAKEQSDREEKKSNNKVEPVKVPRVKSKAAKVEKGTGLTLSPSHQSPSNRMVTDSEGGSTLSTLKDVLGESFERNRSKPKVPSAIVTTSPANSKVETADDELLKSDNDSSVDDTTSDSKPPSVLRASTYSSNESINSSTGTSDDSDTDDEEVMMWASKMFGVAFRPPGSDSSGLNVGEEEPSPVKKLRLKLKLARSEPQHDDVMKDVDYPRKKKKTNKSKRKRRTDMESDKGETVLPLKKRKGKSKKRNSIGSGSYDHEETEKERMRKESAKPLTLEQIKAILGEDDFTAQGGSNWVRRSVRQPSKALLSAKPLRMLIEKLKYNDPDMVVLKMKKYINDPNAPSVVLDEALDALEENTNCQSLYIQNFNEGMRDKQVLHLLRILQNPKCNIWCLNIGENYNVKTRTWDKFTKGLKKTKVTHMYASEHTITTEMKDEIRSTIRNNRKKHDMHINPDNLHVIVQCTHCWWNPINAKVLRPYLKKEGFEHILTDKEAQGLRGSSSAAPSV